MRDKLVEFYTSELAMTIWIEQEDCTILKRDNLVLGFCQRESADTGGIICFWFDTKRDVDVMYERFRSLAEGPPAENARYRIYHFFFRDPEGRRLEIQKFLDF